MKKTLSVFILLAAMISSAHAEYYVVYTGVGSCANYIYCSKSCGQSCPDCNQYAVDVRDGHSAQVFYGRPVVHRRDMNKDFIDYDPNMDLNTADNDIE